MTRARSLLNIYTNAGSYVQEAVKINSVLKHCLDTLLPSDQSVTTTNALDDIADLLGLIGPQHETWLRDLWKEHKVVQEPLIADDGEILAEPAFWFRSGTRTYACFGDLTLGQSTKHRLQDRKVSILELGKPVPPSA